MTRIQEILNQLKESGDYSVSKEIQASDHNNNLHIGKSGVLYLNSCIGTTDPNDIQAFHDLFDKTSKIRQARIECIEAIKKKASAFDEYYNEALDDCIEIITEYFGDFN